MKVLVILSDPPQVALPRLRLDREARLLAELAKRFSSEVTIERLHASNIDDIHFIIGETDFDVVQFSGHGNPNGIYLDKRDMAEGGELVSPQRLQSLLSIASKPPLLVLLLACYSSDSRDVLADVAPFVVSTTGEVEDSSCLEFIRAFYERLFSGYAIQKSFEDAMNILRSKLIPEQAFELSRRQLIRKGTSRFIESTPDTRRNSILVNLDQVVDKLALVGLKEEQVFQLIAKKLTIHYWIFSVPRDRCVIPIGRLLFGEFSWKDASDVVYCTKIMKLGADVSPKRWHAWHRLLVSYNDLASCEYRSLSAPAEPANRTVLTNAVKLFDYYAKRYVKPGRDEMEQIGYSHLIPNFEFVLTHCDAAVDQLTLERFPQVVRCLEQALTNYHEIVDALQPPEDLGPSEPPM
jgi:hypothetical protein